jgi:prolyl-tRNA editing enzyme YbaK/EbsC (Cys-tRNA(Pro) deacylase)
MTHGTLETLPVAGNEELLAEAVRQGLANMTSAGVLVARIDPSYSDTAAFCDAYQVTPEQCANCVIVEGKGGEHEVFAACMVLGNMKLDVNGAVRSALGTKKVSFAKMDDAVTKTGMEYGAITPVGIPSEWRILVSAEVAAAPWVVIGSGLRSSKLIVPGPFLASLPNATVITNLAKPRE